MTFSRRIQRLNASGIRRMFDLAAKLKNPINLSIGQPHFDIPDTVKQAAINAVQLGRNAYTQTQGVLPLREAILDKYLTRGIPQEDGFITSGVTGGLFLAMFSLCDPGDEIVMTDPYFVFNRGLAELFDIVPKLVDTYPDFHWRQDRLEAAITPKTRAIIVTSPNNPTGTACSEAELKMIAEVARRHDLWVIYDEIYAAYNYDAPHFDMSRYYPEKTITLGGFSKSHSMTGWRIGTAVGPKAAIGQMLKLQQYSYVCAPTVGQWAALSAIDVVMEEAIADYKRKRDYLYEQLSPYYNIVKPDGAFYMFIEAPHGMGGEEFVLKAIDHNLILVPGNVFSEHDTHFRLSYAASQETIDRGIEVLREMATVGAQKEMVGDLLSERC
jgi:aspartate/methionine/tyrosine aminotransferase